jgi:transcriptional antiterminator NusG
MGLEKIDASDFDIQPGDNVRVISGALETFLGTVDEVNMEKQKVRVIVHMFGRQTPVELDFNQIEKINL